MDLGNDREHLDKPTKCISAGNFCCFKSLQPAGGGPGYDGCRLGSSSDVVTSVFIIDTIHSSVYIVSMVFINEYY